MDKCGVLSQGFKFFSLFDLVSAVKFKNTAHFCMPGVMPMVSVTFLAREVVDSIPAPCNAEHGPRTLSTKKKAERSSVS